jgi:hypothetical protein
LRIELWQWRYTDDLGKRRIFPCRLADHQGREAIADAERVESSLEIRRPLGSTSDRQRLAES